MDYLKKVFDLLNKELRENDKQIKDVLEEMRKQFVGDYYYKLRTELISQGYYIETGTPLDSDIGVWVWNNKINGEDFFILVTEDGFDRVESIDFHYR